MASTLASLTNAKQYNGRLRRMGHIQIKQSLDGERACCELAGFAEMKTLTLKM